MRFVIPGNQNDPRGNPLAYYRMTQRSKFADPRAVKYHAWCNYVRDCAQVGGLKSDSIKKGPKMIAGMKKSTLNIMIYFKNRHHADPSNVFKGVEDALYDLDKYVRGSFDFDYDPKKPRVEAEVLR